MISMIDSLEALDTAVKSMGFAAVMNFLLLGVMVVLVVGLIKVITNLIKFKETLGGDINSATNLMQMQRAVLEQMLWEVRGTRSDLRETIHTLLQFILDRQSSMKSLEDLAEKLKVLQPSELKEPPQHGD